MIYLPPNGVHNGTTRYYNAEVEYRIYLDNTLVERKWIDQSAEEGWVSTDLNIALSGNNVDIYISDKSAHPDISKSSYSESRFVASDLKLEFLDFTPMDWELAQARCVFSNEYVQEELEISFADIERDLREYTSRGAVFSTKLLLNAGYLKAIGHTNKLVIAGKALPLTQALTNPYTLTATVALEAANLLARALYGDDLWSAIEFAGDQHYLTKVTNLYLCTDQQ